MNFAAWQKATGCTSGPEPGATALAEVLLQQYPEGWSGGIFNCRKVRGSSQPSMHGEGRAFDLMLPVVGGKGHPVGHEIVARLGAVGVTLGVQCIIFDRKIWSARSPQGRPYTGVHPHYDHLHIELTREAARRLTAVEVSRILGPRFEPAPVSPSDAVSAFEEPAKGWVAEEPEVSAGATTERRSPVPDLRDGWRRNLERLRRRR